MAADMTDNDDDADEADVDDADPALFHLQAMNAEEPSQGEVDDDGAAGVGVAASDEDGAAAVQQRIDAEESLLSEDVGGEQRRQDHVRSGESLSGDL